METDKISITDSKYPLGCNKIPSPDPKNSFPAPLAETSKAAMMLNQDLHRQWNRDTQAFVQGCSTTRPAQCRWARGVYMVPLDNRQGRHRNHKAVAVNSTRSTT